MRPLSMPRPNQFNDATDVYFRVWAHCRSHLGRPRFRCNSRSAGYPVGPRPLRRVDLRQRPGTRGLEAMAGRGAARTMVFVRPDGAMGAVRQARSQGERRTRPVGFRRRDQLARGGSQELYRLDALARRLARERRRESFTVWTLSQDALHASVVARLTPNNWLRKSDRENEIRYDLVWERGRWAIDDVHSVIERNAWSLRAILAHYLAE